MYVSLLLFPDWRSSFVPVQLPLSLLQIAADQNALYRNMDVRSWTIVLSSIEQYYYTRNMQSAETFRKQ